MVRRAVTFFVAVFLIASCTAPARTAFQASPSVGWSGSEPRQPWESAGTTGDVETITGYYGPDAGHRFVLYQRTDLSDEPLVVYIHGGAWSGGNPLPLPESVRRMTDRGYAVATIDFRLGLSYPAPVVDVMGALAYFSINPMPFDGSRPIVIGFSSGAYLAAMAATDGRDPAYRPYEPFYPSSPSAAVLLAAPTDLPVLIDSLGYPQNVPIRDFVGPGCDWPAPSSCVPDGASPVDHVTPDDPPLYLVNSIEDERIPLSSGQHTLLMDRAMEEGVRATSLEVHTTPTYDGEFTSYHNGTLDQFDADAFLDWLSS